MPIEKMRITFFACIETFPAFRASNIRGTKVERMVTKEKRFQFLIGKNKKKIINFFAVI